MDSSPLPVPNVFHCCQLSQAALVSQVSQYWLHCLSLNALLELGKDLSLAYSCHVFNSVEFAQSCPSIGTMPGSFDSFLVIHITSCCVSKIFRGRLAYLCQEHCVLLSAWW